MSDLLNQSARIAFAALIHDLGKFAERTRLSISKETEEKTNNFIAHSTMKKGITATCMPLIPVLPLINWSNICPI